jgi:hypothetical protein
MRISKHLIGFLATLLLVPAVAGAQTSATAPAQKPKAAAKAAAKAATHSTSGVIKSVDGTTLVIAKTAKAAKTDTFVLNAETITKGDLVVGGHVGVRYTTEGGQNIATAVTVTAKGKNKRFPTSSH